MSGLSSLSALILWFGISPVPNVATGLSPSALDRGGTAITINDNNGGAVVTFAHRVADLADTSILVRIEGGCSSACTLITALPPDRICVGPGAHLDIHQASFPGGRKDGRLTHLMWDVYPEWLQQTVGDPDLLSSDLVVVDYEELLNFYASCSE